LLVGFDPVVEDPAPDRHHPPSLVQLSFESFGSRLNGVFYLATGEGPHPTVVVLHGFPGFERNMDLAQAYRRAGWNALVFHYRGAWGSQGDFSFGHVLEDVHSAVGFVRSNTGPFRADPDRIALIGHSMGGWASLMTASEVPALLGAGSLAGWNVGAEARFVRDERRRLTSMFEESLGPLQGITAGSLLREVQQHGAEWNVEGRIAKLAERPLFIAAGSRDTEVPPARHHRPLIDALRAAGASRLTELVWDTDHAFSDHRVALARATIDWLASL
jgi:dipeptidyl aminopeptidase/acylaminoacyl peptidase